MNQHANRRGAILAMALVTVLAVSLLAGLVVQRYVSAHRQWRRQQHALQAEWIAEAAVSRALAQRRADAEYRGETWRTSIGELDERGGSKDRTTTGVAVIQVEDAADHTGFVKFTVQAHYPDDDQQRALVERTYLLPFSQSSEQPPAP